MTIFIHNMQTQKFHPYVYDSGCTLSKYILNGEAHKFQWLRVMVDACTGVAIKKLKLQDMPKRGGHLGCSEGFNSNLFKDHIGF